jgi:membrane protease YdiL (CAAX protease family)
VSGADQNTSLAYYAAAACEVAIWLAGLWLLWRLVLRRTARESKQIRLGEWRLPPIDFACYLCFGIVGALMLSGIAGLLVRHSNLSSDATTILGTVAMDGGFVLGLAGFHLMYAGRDTGAAAPFSLALALRSGLATFIIATPIVAAVTWAWELFLSSSGLPDDKQEVVGIFENAHAGVLKGCFIAVAAILVPLAEELLFRGGLFRYFRTRMPRRAAILVTSVLFGLPHVSWGDHMSGLPSLVPLIVLAAVFCVAYERTGSIGTAIVAHALFNLNMMALVMAGVGS